MAGGRAAVRRAARKSGATTAPDGRAVFMQRTDRPTFRVESEPPAVAGWWREASALDGTLAAVFPETVVAPPGPTGRPPCG